MDESRTGHDDPTGGIVARLERRRASFQRYTLKELVGRGAMGSVLRVWDEDLQRHLAMKVLRGDRTSREGATYRRARFLEEAQVTGQLDHPAIVPVHELGLGSDGELYFTMKLVRGRTLSEVLTLAAEGREGWSLARVLGVVQRVCEALAYAHDRGVIHRDLKPANVMVGQYGEVYVMDWGLARVLDRGGAESPAEGGPEGEPVRSEIRSEQRALAADGSGSALRTEDGTVLGTPAFMAPEQAHGQIARVGPWSDAYAVGAILYDALAGRAPYVTEARGLDNYDVWQLVKSRPPRPLRELAPHVPPELGAICERAMARDIERRFQDAKSVGEELRAYLEDRVVPSYRTGVLVELRKWVSRNRGMTAALAALVIALLAVGAVWLVQAGARQRETRRSLDGFVARELRREVADLWPVHPATVPLLDAWLEDAREVLDRLPRYERELERLDARTADATRVEDPEGLPALLVRREDELASRVEAFLEVLELKRSELARGPEGEPAREVAREVEILEREVEDARRGLERARVRLAAERGWRFADPALERTYEQRFALVRDLRLLASENVPAVEQRADAARTLTERSIGAHRARWERAVASIGDRSTCPAYDGLSLEPQIGLVPLDRDERSGLWEFWHVLSGNEPRRGQDGEFVVEEGTGIVLVLIPGGRFWMGAQDGERAGHNYLDLAAEPLLVPAREEEQPVHAVELDPYFLSKYELTQAQWLRLTGANPSRHFAGSDPKDGERISRMHPVEFVSWNDAVANLAHWGLALPTEAQWERAARAGTETPHWAGTRFDSLLGNVNFCDRRLLASGFDVRVDYDDGFPVHAPVDRVGRNPYGLHGVLGNVSEWCRDWRDLFYRVDDIQPGDGEHETPLKEKKASRGGSFRSHPHELRASWVQREEPSLFKEDLGLRPVRALDATVPTREHRP